MDQLADSDNAMSLVACLKSGDDSAVETLVRMHSGAMLSAARRILNDDALAQDCVQEALINALRKIEDFQERSSLSSWLHRIVVNQALMKLRPRRGATEVPVDEWLPTFDENGCRVEAPWPHLATPDEIVERADVRNLVHQAINQLPESLRLVLQLRDIEELTTREVAEGLDLSETNVKVRLHRARAALKKLLEPVLKGEG